MSQAERIKQASQIKIGGSEDEAKQAVKQLFKKSTAEKYSNYESDTLTLVYEAKLFKLAVLLDHDFNGTLSESDEWELIGLEQDLKGYNILSLNQNLLEVPAFKTAAETKNYTDYLKDLAMFQAPEMKSISKEYISFIENKLIAIKEELYKDMI